MSTIMTDIHDVAALIDQPVRTWPGRCHEIAGAALRYGAVSGHLRYGHYLGPTAETSIWHDRQLIRHGWVELDDGRIWDPTRWVFEAAAPYIFCGEANEDYDIGGNSLRAQLRGPVPIFDAADGRTWTLPKALLPRIQKHLTPVQENLSFNQLIWLANSSPQELGDLAKPLYLWLEDIHKRALIPIDNWNWIME